VLSVRGDLDMTTAPELRHQLLEILDSLDAPIKTLTLNLAALAFMDSSGLALLYIAQRDARRQGLEFMLYSLPDQPRRLLELTELTSQFPVREDDRPPGP
jgi:anti-anti-sigma factor